MEKTKAITCGTHFGDTNDPASIETWPDFSSKSIKVSFWSNEMNVFSFCNPSLGPTSTILTREGILLEDKKRPMILERENGLI